MIIQQSLAALCLATSSSVNCLPILTISTLNYSLTMKQLICCRTLLLSCAQSRKRTTLRTADMANRGIHIYKWIRSRHRRDVRAFIETATRVARSENGKADTVKGAKLPNTLRLFVSPAQITNPVEYYHARPYNPFTLS